MILHLLEYLNHTLITCSRFSQDNSVVFDPIPSQSLKGYFTLTSAHAYQVSVYSIKQSAKVEANFLSHYNFDYAHVTLSWKFFKTP